ncbi:MAG TPA: hypothetical protein VN181_10355, partial [Thermoanaerobaculia bacterium]|nr:hypothetical protein [Thermoanaerobaculia bacterium]
MRALALTLLVSSSLFAQSTIPNSPGRKPTVAIRNATIYPVSKAPIANGTIVFANGVITAVGTNVTIPANATVIDGTGLSVYPGMIDSGSTVGLVEIDSVDGTVDTTELGDLNPNARASVAINPHSNLIPVTRVNGVTAVVSTPQGGIISGQSAVVQLAGWTNAEMTIKTPAAMNLRFPRAPIADQAQEEEEEKEAKKSYTKELDKLRDVLRDAQSYAKAAGAKTQRFDNDVILEALVPVVEGRVPVVINANLARDIKAAIELADEFKLKMILAGGQDVARVIPELKAHNIPVILGPVLALPPREDDPYDLLFTNARTLYDAGIRFSIQTGGEEGHNTRNLPYQA